MSTNHKSTVVGVFDDRAHAQLAVENLLCSGFAENQIAMFMHRDVGPEVTDLDAAKAAQISGESKAGMGAAIGAAIGGVVGVGAALATGLFPVVVPAVTVATTTFGAVAGATGGGVVGNLIGSDFPAEHARLYERELKAGRVLLGVQADKRDAEAAAIIYRSGGFDATSIRPDVPAGDSAAGLMQTPY
jgi:hypothetical protein